MCSDIILLVLFSRVWAYDLTSCDMSCDCIYVPLHHQIIIKGKEKKSQNKKKNISVQAHHNKKCNIFSLMSSKRSYMLKNLRRLLVFIEKRFLV